MPSDSQARVIWSVAGRQFLVPPYAWVLSAGDQWEHGGPSAAFGCEVQRGVWIDRGHRVPQAGVEEADVTKVNLAAGVDLMVSGFKDVAADVEVAAPLG
jgi:hypothetical protein